jgi:hypothetical protein
MAQQLPVGQGLLIIEDSWSHSDTPHSVGRLRTSVQSDTETSTWQHTTQETDIRAPSGIRTHNTSKRAATDPRLDLYRAATEIGPSNFKQKKSVHK